MLMTLRFPEDHYPRICTRHRMDELHTPEIDAIRVLFSTGDSDTNLRVSLPRARSVDRDMKIYT
jgi:hypothetical protein